MRKALALALVALALGSCKKQEEEKIKQPIQPNCNCKTVTRVGDPFAVSVIPSVWKQNIYYNNDCTNVSTYETVDLGPYKLGDKKCN
jgi:hypothetical protein